MDRISRQVMFMDMAEVAARRATCYRGNVGALVVKDNDILSTGYNGPPSGEDHCHGNTCQLRPDGGCARSIHAEANAINRAVIKNKGQKLHHHDLYCTYSPCPDCAKSVFNNYMARVFYRYSYRIRDGIDFLIKNKIRVYRVTPAGYIISEETGQIIDPRDLA